MDKSQSDTYKYLLADARKALADNRLFSALESLRGMATFLKAGNEADELARLTEAYRQLLDYMVRGADDPARNAMYRHFVVRAHELSTALERRGELAEESSFYARAYRKHSPLREGISGESLMPDHGWMEPEVFNMLWLSAPFTPAEEAAWSDWFTTSHDETSLYRACLAVSGLTLGAMRFFDVAKYRILLDLCLSADVMLRVRAMVGLIFVHLLHAERVKLYPDVVSRLKLLSDADGFRQEMELLQAQLFLTLETQRIEQGLQKEMMPEVMKRMKGLRLNRTLGLEELKDKLSEADLNPEWEEDGTPSKLAGYLREFAELQQRGADMYMGTFKMLKQRFPFFSVAANWFWPFTFRHPDIPEDARNNPTINLLVRGAALCDSDKYSFCLMASMLPAGVMGEGLKQKLEEAMGGDASPGTDFWTNQPTEVTFKEALRSYVQGFYRFCHLFVHRDAFVNPFKLNMFLADYPPFDSLLVENDFLGRMADLAFKDKSWLLAFGLYSRISPEHCTAGRYQRMGYCAEQTGQKQKALEAYITADSMKPHSVWTLRRLAALWRNEGQFDKAHNCYEELDSLEPDHADTSLRLAECCIHLKRYDEAFKHLFKANWLDPDSTFPHRALAWCYLLTEQYDKAERYYEKVLADQPTAADWLNAGHAAWLLGKPAVAVERYRKANTQQSSENFLRDDAALLQAAGLSADDLAMMTDAVCSR